MTKMGYFGLFLAIVTIHASLFLSVAQDGTCTRDSLVINPGADVRFTVIITIRQSTDGQTCGTDISDRAIQYIALMEWAVNKFNEKSAIKLGFDVHDDCGLRWKSIDHALNVLDGPVLGSQSCVSAVGSPCQIGIIGTSQSITTEAILYTIANVSLPIITPFVSTEGLTYHPHFYRTVTRDDVNIAAVLSTLRGLGLTYVAVVRANDDFSKFASYRLQELATDYSICIETVIEVQTGVDLDRTALTNIRERAKNNQLRVVYIGSRSIAKTMLEQLNQFHQAEMVNISWLLTSHPADSSNVITTDSLNDHTITITPSYITIVEAEEYVKSKWEMIFNNSNTTAEDLLDLMACSGIPSLPRWTNDHVVSTIDAIFSFGYSLQRQANLHGNQLRNNFRLDIDKQPLVYNDSSIANITEIARSNRSIIFDVNGDIDVGEMTPLYDISVVNNSQLVKIGEFRNHTFYEDTTGDTTYTIPLSTCSIHCETCLNLPEIEYLYIEGDSLIVGIFSVHETDPNDPFQCGEFRLSQLDAVIIESFLHTLEISRNETNINFGALILDDCYSSPRTELVLSQVMSGAVALYKPNSFEIIDVSKIIAVVSVLGSTVTKSVAGLMNKLNIPVITASASSKDLDDRINYPYFLRTVPSDEEQVKAMISIIRQMEWKYISLMYVENNYGQKGKESLVESANTSDICIAISPVGISGVSSEDSNTDLLEAYNTLDNQRSNVVVYFGTERRISDFLTVLEGKNDFVFLASEDWGDRQYLLDIQGKSAKGSITLKNEVAPLTDSAFAEFIRTLNPIANPRNYWFTQYWEETFLCDLPQSFQFRYSKPCADSLRFSEDDIEYFLKDQRIVHTIELVRAVTKGLKQSKERHCNFENTFPCPKYFEFVEEVVKFIREVTIDRGGVQTRVFKDDGNGNVGFTLNNVQEINSVLEYVQVGSFDEGRLVLDKNRLQFGERIVNGRCVSTLCDHCTRSNTSGPVVIETTTHSHPIEEGFGTPDYTILGILGFLCLLIIIFGIVIVCYFRRRVKELESQLKKTCYEMKTGYLTTTYRTPERPKENGSVTYPEMQFVGSTSGTADDTLYDWKKAQYQLAGGGMPNGFVNRAFVGSDPYLISRNHSDENQNYSQGSPRRHISSSAKSEHNSSNDRADSTNYVPSSSTSYGLTSNSSFKKVGDSQPHVKKQPRTQLAVPPCRPELPPRDAQSAPIPRPEVFPDNLDILPAAVPKDKVRNRKGSPRRNVSPPSFKTSPTGVNPPYLLDKLESPRYKGPSLGNSIIPPGSPQIDPEKLNVGGSLEKISRV